MDKSALLKNAILAVVLGGGVGNFIDRLFRPQGVVDFIVVRVYGFLGFEDWPVFNVADSAIVCGMIALFVSVVFLGLKERGKTKSA